MNLLNDIVSTKRKEIETLKREKSLEAIRREAESHPLGGRRPFAQLFKNEKSAALITEIKPRSPSAHILIERDPLEIADTYALSTADAISVLTDAHYFGGHIGLLRQVRDRVTQPLLRKDFIIDEYQVYETHLAGADAFLLIATVLETKQLAAFMRLGESFKLDVLTEVHDENDLKKALDAEARLIGINNRNLRTLAIDISVTEKLSALVPKGVPFISESGIGTVEDVQRVRACGARGILVGTSILQSSDPVEKIAEFKRALSS